MRKDTCYSCGSPGWVVADPDGEFEGGFCDDEDGLIQHQCPDEGEVVEQDQV